MVVENHIFIATLDAGFVRAVVGNHERPALLLDDCVGLGDARIGTLEVADRPADEGHRCFHCGHFSFVEGRERASLILGRSRILMTDGDREVGAALLVSQSTISTDSSMPRTVVMPQVSGMALERIV